jgi:hypothetical protein
MNVRDGSLTMATKKTLTVKPWSLLREVVPLSVLAEKICGDSVPWIAAPEVRLCIHSAPRDISFFGFRVLRLLAIRNRLATVLRTPKRFRGVAIIPEPSIHRNRGTRGLGL